MLETSELLTYMVRLIIIFLILPLHEYAHAWSAHKMGDDTALYAGRLTLNPIAHIDPIGAICLLFAGFGWAKPVPINPLHFKKQRAGIALTAAAGPLSNLAAALVAMIVYRIYCCMDFVYDAVEQYYLYNVTSTPYYMLLIFQIFISVNLGLALFNLIPVPPLDGSKIVSYFTSYRVDKFLFEHQRECYFVMLILMMTGALSTPLNWVADRLYDLMFYLTDWIPLVAEKLA